jgi:hypothetical protein
MNFKSIKKFFKKNYKKIIVVCLIMLLLSNKMYENFTTTQALDAVKSTEVKVNDVYYSIDKDWVRTKKAIYSAKGIKTDGPVKVGKITLAKDGDKIWAPNMQVDNIKVQNSLNMEKDKKFCIGGTCIDENHLQMLTGQKDIGIKSNKNKKYLSNWDWKNDSSRGGKRNKHGHWATAVGQFRGGKGDWERLRLVKY